MRRMPVVFHDGCTWPLLHVVVRGEGSRGILSPLLIDPEFVVILYQVSIKSSAALANDNTTMKSSNDATLTWGEQRRIKAKA